MLYIFDWEAEGASHRSRVKLEIIQVPIHELNETIKNTRRQIRLQLVGLSSHRIVLLLFRPNWSSYPFPLSPEVSKNLLKAAGVQRPFCGDRSNHGRAQE